MVEGQPHIQKTISSDLSSKDKELIQLCTHRAPTEALLHTHTHTHAHTHTCTHHLPGRYDPRTGPWGISLRGRDQSLLESSFLCRSFLCQWGAVETAEEIHPAHSTGPGHGQARRRGPDPGGGAESGGGFPEDRRSAGWSQQMLPAKRKRNHPLCSRVVVNLPRGRGCAGVEGTALLLSDSVLYPWRYHNSCLCP